MGTLVKVPMDVSFIHHLLVSEVIINILPACTCSLRVPLSIHCMTCWGTTADEPLFIISPLSVNRLFSGRPLQVR